jgi:putative ABC transport system permease protein
MTILRIAARNLVRRRARTFAIGGLFAAVVCAMTVANALLDGAEAGVRTSYVDSFSGELSLRASSREAFSVFGSQTPIIGSLSRIPTIGEYDRAISLAREAPGIASATSIACGIVALEANGYRKPASVFGIDPDSYFAAFPAIKTIEGRPLMKGEAGIMITASRREAIESTAGGRIAIGDEIGLGYYDSNGFELARVPLVGVIEYPVSNDTLDSIVLVDADTLRGLLGLAREAAPATGAAPGGAAGGPGPGGSVAAGSIDSLFEGAGDRKADPAQGLRVEDVEALLRSDAGGLEAEAGPSTAYNFILLRLLPGAGAAKAARFLRSAIADEGLDLTVSDWRGTSGSAAIYVSWLRTIVAIAFGIIAVAGAVVIVNALVICVFERWDEIGTMRALGAGRTFIAVLLAVEIALLLGASAAVGIGLGAFACAAISWGPGIALANETAATLFGSSTLKPAISLLVVARDAAAAVAIGIAAFLYPIRLALRIEPARAMGAE